MYRKPVGLSPATHNQLKITEIKSFEFASGTWFAPLCFGELRRVAREYLIVFGKTPDTGVYALLKPRQELSPYINNKGHWRSAYKPKYILSYPFVVNGDAALQDPLLIDFEASCLSTTEGVPLFNQDETPADVQIRFSSFVQATRQDLAAAKRVAAKLDKMDLLVEKPLHITMRSNNVIPLSGFRVLDGEKFGKLSPDQLSELHVSGAMLLAYAHIVSLANMQDGMLLDDVQVAVKPVGDQGKDFSTTTHAGKQLMEPQTSQRAHFGKAETPFKKGQEQEKKGDLQTALRQYLQALKIAPSNPAILLCCANTLYLLYQYEEALKTVCRSLQLHECNASAHRLQAGILTALGRNQEALVSISKAIFHDPENPTHHASRSRMNLRFKNFETGWDEFGWRFKANEINVEGFKSQKFNLPLWQPGKPCKRIFLWREQGVGEDLLFGSLLQEAENFAKEVVAVIDKRLVPIFMRSLPQISFVTDRSTLKEQDFDAQMPLGDLGSFLRRTESDFISKPGKYLLADQGTVRNIKAHLADNGKKLVGISWRSKRKLDGSVIHTKSLTLKDMAPVLELSNIQFINLQYGEVQEELDAFENETGIHIRNNHGVDLFNDLDGLAALISACDAVVSSSSVTAQLAGALGKKSWILLSRNLDRFWFWHEGDGPNLWFPSLFQLSQSKQGDWVKPVAQLKQLLEVWVSEAE